MRCVRAIPTMHHASGVLMRSRLEDKWARYLESYGIKCEYEVKQFVLPSGKYLPDFALTIPIRMEDIQGQIGHLWLEIKGRKPDSLQLAKIGELAVQTKHNCLLFWGNPMKFKCFYAYSDGAHGWREKYSHAGIYDSSKINWIIDEATLWQTL
jgi:hypothetical protein